MTPLYDALSRARAAGRKLLVPYIVGGIPDRPGFARALAAVAENADAVEIGLPYSDPLMDGPAIAAAAERCIRAGIGPLEALDLAGGVEIAAPRIAMTYYNPIHKMGEADFCRRMAKAGFSGLIVPDLPLEESASLRNRTAEEGLAWIPLVAPTSAPERAARIAATATGFVYAVSTLGVTGLRKSLSERAAKVVEMCRSGTEAPVLVGIGISTPDHAREAVLSSDGVVVGTAVVTAILERGVEAARTWLEEVRAALDAS